MEERRLRILCISPHFRSGGSERVMLNIINNLDKKKFKVTLLLFNKDGILLNKINEDIEVVNTKASRTRKTILDIKKEIDSKQFDIIFTMKGYIALVVWIAQLFSKTSIPIIYREVTHVSTDLEIKTGLLKILLKVFLKHVYKSHHKIIAPSKAIINDLKENFKVSENKMELIHNPLDIDTIQYLASERTEDDWINEEIPTITSMGRLTEEKDFKTLINAVKIVNETTEVKLIIIGEGQKECELKEYAQDLGVGDKVKFVGVQSNPFKYISKSQVYVLSSLYEGFPNALVEAMACGTPVIATNCTSGVGDIITDYKDGIVVPVGDPKTMANEIKYLITNKEIAMKFSKMAEKKVVEMLDLKKIIKKYEEIFQIN